MKLAIAFALIALSTISCKKTTPARATDNYEKYELISVTGGWVPVVYTGDEIGYSQSILLFKDSTFKKERKINGDTLAAAGAYTSRIVNGDLYIILLYDKRDNPLRQGISSDNNEFLLKKNDHTMINDARAADGPMLTYQKTN